MFGFAPGCFGETVIVHAQLMVAKPPTISFEDAATTPTCFVTAFTAFDGMALTPLCKVCPFLHHLVHFLFFSFPHPPLVTGEMVALTLFCPPFIYKGSHFLSLSFF